MKRIAFIISRVFDPALLTAVLILFIVLLSPLNLQEKFIWIIIFEILDFIIPIGVFAYLHKTKQVSDIDITDRKERLPLFRLTTSLYGISFFLSLLFKLPQEVIITSFSAFVIMAVWTTITPYWKISAHIAGITTCTLLIYFLTDLTWIRWVGPLLIILIAWSRYIQKKHTLKQLVGALILSSILVIGIVGIVKF
ncbi:MAG: Membrane-associated phospholipid phosphatase [Berkelbacteria bacterium GW2011_GWA2_38_9]|uniref:Membrane-associated phospholipid phosphatase n=1 Tax=Berkelbacteria bacterium GW2011_GWA2_38_9 TaxID=1618334 RepID=A0A0G0NMW6_9BACT|nr:MAG: Membrane-associated phospholipid phosphatase [Berkelbacteria bacterium GW2011_GWA2_38_9]